MAFFAAAALVGTAVNAIGQYQSALAQAESLKNQANISKAQASEILFRNKLNNDLVERQALQFAGKQKAQIAGSGIGFTASSLALLEETALFAAEEIALNTRVAEWDATLKNLEADAMLRSARGIKKAGIMAAFGAGATGTAQTFRSSPGTTTSPNPTGAGATSQGALSAGN